MNRISTGEDSTLGVYRRIAIDIFGEDSPAVALLDRKIDEAPLGEDEEVVAPEDQVLYLLMNAHHNPAGKAHHKPIKEDQS